jgi:hypothetical protein
MKSLAVSWSPIVTPPSSDFIFSVRRLVSKCIFLDTQVGIRPVVELVLTQSAHLFCS